MINEFFLWIILFYKGYCFKFDEELIYCEVLNKIVYCVIKLIELFVIWFLFIVNNWVFFCLKVRLNI